MRKKSLLFVSVTFVGTLAIFAFVVPRVNGTFIIKSKSNISNNRTAGAVAAPIVICASCSIVGMPEESYLILMDSQNGEVWAYSDPAVIGQAAPVYLSTFTGVGKQFLKQNK